ncbi:unnamed protein product [Didymodactylos carnosus]|uniref:Cyanovirin-N domain-containing protein n=1 Tax=Didymodactylos carnosus TaxID=1234261 RepID=A0A813VH12_9BILA|nr:unnamed protein product [Didymodactylos carnosus]CAF1094382.1 unnamed protein product [Didymodactylos carnosus]CAF3628974.1 unnamed protein product [Didymodactylos carnosus]CAF3855839.1 unnamed protein product [Didymodactylos carnosus]
MSNFTATSTDIGCQGCTLSATCQRTDGTKVPSSINLDEFIANNDGKLSKQNGGNFSASCDNIRVDSSGRLTCTATKIDGSKVPAAINLNDCIGNFEGELQCS